MACLFEVYKWRLFCCSFAAQYQVMRVLLHRQLLCSQVRLLMLQPPLMRQHMKHINSHRLLCHSMLLLQEARFESCIYLSLVIYYWLRYGYTFSPSVTLLIGTCECGVVMLAVTSVCVCVCLTVCCNFWKPWPRKFSFVFHVQLWNI